MAKRRFGPADVSVSCEYNMGKFVYISKHDMNELKNKIALDQLKDNIKTSKPTDNKQDVQQMQQAQEEQDDFQFP